MDLAETVNRNLMALRLIERALNERAGWTIRYGGLAMEAQVITSDAGVTFWALVPAGRGDRSSVAAAICHNGEMLWVVRIEAPETAPFEIEVTVSAAESTASV